jgi:type II secretory pathway pseudopilin PulG
MRFTPIPGRRPAKAGHFGFTLQEVVISLMLSGLTIGGLILGYVMSTQRAEWSAYSLAANSLALQGLEKARAAKWDLRAFPVIDQLVPANFPQQVDILDVPIAGTNIVYATNITTITTISANPPLRMIRVDCVWPFMDQGVFTNTAATYRAPDQ